MFQDQILGFNSGLFIFAATKRKSVFTILDKFLVMKRITLLSVLLLLAVASVLVEPGCRPANNPDRNEPELSGTDLDSARVLSIIAFRDSLLNKASLRQRNQDLNPSILDGNNRYDYLTWDNGDAMYHGIFKTDSGEVRVMLFLQNGKLVNINYRVGITRPTRLAKEAFLYYNDKQELNYVEEHSMLLKENEMPSVLINQPYMASIRPLEEWEQEIKPYKDSILAKITGALSDE